MTRLFVTLVSLALTVTIAAVSPLWAASEGPVMSPDQALEMLKKGNTRYVAANPEHPNQGFDRRELTASKGQNPFAAVLSCSDSRVPIEILFDCGVGDIFVIRVAGNVANVDEVASIEYSVDHLNTPLLVVLGHTHCGAVQAVAQNAEVHGNLPKLVKSIVPAVEKARQRNPKATPEALLNDAIRANVWQAIEDLFKISPVTAKRVKDGKLKVIGAIYSIDTGAINWMGAHDKQDELIAKSIAGQKDSH
ncbi:MAG: carbonic anhydrase [Desulfomonile tiedjei]|nr:carbonic anhydrase [Desulfomonile tiedjei]